MGALRRRDCVVAALLAMTRECRSAIPMISAPYSDFCRPRQPKVLAQGRTFVVLLEYPAPLQLRYHELHKILECTGDVRAAHHVAVARALHEPLFQPVGDFLRTAD